MTCAGGALQVMRARVARSGVTLTLWGGEPQNNFAGLQFCISEVSFTPGFSPVTPQLLCNLGTVSTVYSVVAVWKEPKWETVETVPQIIRSFPHRAEAAV